MAKKSRSNSSAGSKKPKSASEAGDRPSKRLCNLEKCVEYLKPKSRVRVRGIDQKKQAPGDFLLSLGDRELVMHFDREYYTYEMYVEEYQFSVNHLQRYYEAHARVCLDWNLPFTKVFEGSFLKGTWFEDGMLNACYNCIDRHFLKNPGKTAIICEGNDLQARYFTFESALREILCLSNFFGLLSLKHGLDRELNAWLKTHTDLKCLKFDLNMKSKDDRKHLEIEACEGSSKYTCMDVSTPDACFLKEIDSSGFDAVKAMPFDAFKSKCDFSVAIYMPMCAESVFSVLACARLGIPHNVIFGGYNAESLAMRIKDSNAQIIVTVDFAFREKKQIDFLVNVQSALRILEKDNYFVSSVLVFDSDEVFMKLDVETFLYSDLKRSVFHDINGHIKPHIKRVADKNEPQDLYSQVSNQNKNVVLPSDDSEKALKDEYPSLNTEDIADEFAIREEAYASRIQEGNKYENKNLSNDCDNASSKSCKNSPSNINDQNISKANEKTSLNIDSINSNIGDNKITQSSESPSLNIDNLNTDILKDKCLKFPSKRDESLLQIDPATMPNRKDAKLFDFLYSGDYALGSQKITASNLRDSQYKSNLKMPGTELSTEKDVAYDFSAFIPCRPVGAEHPLFALYTSGSTGKPKGLVHTTGGYLLYTMMTTKKIFNLKNNDVFLCTADLGWITGHSYCVYGPLLNNTTTVLIGGNPTFPSEFRLFETVERFKATVLYTSPTLIRMLQKAITNQTHYSSSDNTKEDQNLKDHHSISNNNDFHSRDVNKKSILKEEGFTLGKNKDLQENTVMANNNKDYPSSIQDTHKVKNLVSAFEEVSKGHNLEDTLNKNTTNTKDKHKGMHENMSNQNLQAFTTDANADKILQDDTLKEDNIFDKNYHADKILQDDSLKKDNIYDQNCHSSGSTSPFVFDQVQKETLYKDNTNLRNHGFNISSLRILGSVGEPINKEAYDWFRNHFGPKLMLIDTYWQTEAGGILLSPIPYCVKPIPECACIPFFGQKPEMLILQRSESSQAFKTDVCSNCHLNTNKQSQQNIQAGSKNEIPANKLHTLNKTSDNITKMQNESIYTFQDISIVDIASQTKNNVEKPLSILEPCCSPSLGSLAFKNPWPGIARTILNNNDRFLQYFKDNHYITGDEAIVKQQLFYIKGRADDVLNVAGHRLSTAEIESKACSNEHVNECAVVGVRDDIQGQSLVLFCVCKTESNLKENKNTQNTLNQCLLKMKQESICTSIKQTLRDRIGPVINPKKIYLINDLPKTRTGKIMRRVLRKILELEDVGDLSTCANPESIEVIRNQIVEDKI